MGVQVKDGSYVPDGTSTVGTKITITWTGDDIESGSRSETCTTSQSTVEDGSTASYCLAPQSKLERRAALHQTPTQGMLPSDQTWYANAGETVTIKQVTVNENLLIDPATATIEPCEVAEAGDFFCFTPDNPYEKSTDVVFDDAGLPPVAEDDSATTKYGTQVSIPLSDNDTPKAPVKNFEPVTKPKHGKVGFGLTDDGADGIGSYAAQYTPDKGFIGTDSFTYSITTANGTATATATVTVDGPPPTAVDDRASTSEGKAVVIKVLANDSANYPNGTPEISGITRPKHGDFADAPGFELKYVPKKGFTGTDTFRYTIDTPYGTDTATVTVTVTGLGVDAKVKKRDKRDELADTGTQSAELVGYGTALVIGGGLAIGAGTRRRRRARHAAR
ncbi:hypothetical protein GCM10027265_25590 [Jatrophihabitans fulvus]